MSAAGQHGLVAAFIVAVVGVTVTSQAVASANTSRGKSDYRSWTFKELHIAKNTFRPKPIGFDKPTVVYRLPRGAHEGGNDWWIIRLHLVIEVNPRSALGSEALIGAGANQVGTASASSSNNQQVALQNVTVSAPPGRRERARLQPVSPHVRHLQLRRRRMTGRKPITTSPAVCRVRFTRRCRPPSLCSG